MTRLKTNLGALVALVTATSGSCQRSVYDKRCPCLPGWVCCADSICRPGGTMCSAVAPGDAGSDVGTDSTDVGTTDLNVALPQVPPVCMADGWCWANPPAGPFTFDHVWGTGARDLWLTGPDYGLHLDQGGWSQILWPNIAGLSGLWGTASEDVWAVGAAATEHFKGGAWIEADRGPGGAAIWGSAPDDIWVVGAAPDAAHWDGHGWTLVPLPPDAGTLLGIWGSARDDIWGSGCGLQYPSAPAGCFSGAMVHWDGVAWKSIPVGWASQAIRGRGRDDVWSAGEFGGVHHWNGVQWSISSAPDSLKLLFDVIGSGDVWGLADQTVMSWNGARWMSATSPVGSSPTSLWGSAANDIWAIDQLGALQRWNGTAWANILPARVAVDDMRAVAGSSPRDVWAIEGFGNLLHFDGTRWLTMYVPTDTTPSAVWAASPTDVWVVASLQSAHWDGRFWSLVPIPVDEVLNSVWGSNNGDVWAVSLQGTILRWNGSAWTIARAATGRPLKALWGTSASDVWAVGEETVHWDGVAWSASSGAPPYAEAVWASGPNDVWVTASFNSVWRYDGKTWRMVLDAPEAMNGLLNGIWGSGPNDVWAVGGKTWHWDGAAWTAEPDHRPSLTSVWGSGTDDVWAVGEAGAILHRKQ